MMLQKIAREWTMNAFSHCFYTKSQYANKYYKPLNREKEWNVLTFYSLKNSFKRSETTTCCLWDNTSGSEFSSHLFSFENIFSTLCFNHSSPLFCFFVNSCNLVLHLLSILGFLILKLLLRSKNKNVFESHSNSLSFWLSFMIIIIPRFSWAELQQLLSCCSPKQEYQRSFSQLCSMSQLF